MGWTSFTNRIESRLEKQLAHRLQRLGYEVNKSMSPASHFIDARGNAFSLPHTEKICLIFGCNAHLYTTVKNRSVSERTDRQHYAVLQPLASAGKILDFNLWKVSMDHVLIKRLTSPDEIRMFEKGTSRWCGWVA